MTTNIHQIPTEHMHDVSIEMNDGLWRLQQSSGLDEYSIIDLHPVQIRLLAEHAGLLAAPSMPLNGLSASHVRRLKALHERIEELYFDNSHTSEIMKCCGDGFEIMNHLRTMHEQAQELVNDIEDSVQNQKNEEIAPFDTDKGANHDTKKEKNVVKSAKQLVLT